MIRIEFCFLVVLVNFLFGCSGETNDKDRTHIVVVGTAVNMVSGAAVESNGSIYYLDDVLSWDEHTLGKKVKVEGDLFVKIYPPPPCPEPAVDPGGSPPPPPTSRIVGDFKQIIKDPQWSH